MAYLSVSLTRKQEAENAFVSRNETATSPLNVSAAVYQWHIVPQPNLPDGFSALLSVKSALGLPQAGTDRQTDTSVLGRAGSAQGR